MAHMREDEKLVLEAIPDLARSLKLSDATDDLITSALDKGFEEAQKTLEELSSWTGKGKEVLYDYSKLDYKRSSVAATLKELAMEAKKAGGDEDIEEEDASDSKEERDDDDGSVPPPPTPLPAGISEDQMQEAEELEEAEEVGALVDLQIAVDAQVSVKKRGSKEDYMVADRDGKKYDGRKVAGLLSKDLRSFKISRERLIRVAQAKEDEEEELELFGVVKDAAFINNGVFVVVQFEDPDTSCGYRFWIAHVIRMINRPPTGKATLWNNDVYVHSDECLHLLLDVHWLRPWAGNRKLDGDDALTATDYKFMGPSEVKHHSGEVAATSVFTTVRVTESSTGYFVIKVGEVARIKALMAEEIKVTTHERRPADGITRSSAPAEDIVADAASAKTKKTTALWRRKDDVIPLPDSSVEENFWCFARFEGKEEWYPGVIVAIEKDDKFTIHYDSRGGEIYLETGVPLDRIIFYEQRTKAEKERRRKEMRGRKRVDTPGKKKKKSKRGRCR